LPILPDNLFRAEALEHYRRGDGPGSLLRVAPPWTQVLFWTGSLALSSALAFACLGRVEVTARGRGVLRAPEGVRLIQAQVPGTVRALAAPGEPLSAGTLILALDVATVQAELLETERTLGLLEGAGREISNRTAALHQVQREQLLGRIAAFQDQSQSQELSCELSERRLEEARILHLEGILSRYALDDALDRSRRSRRELQALRQGLTAARQELAHLEARRRDEERDRMLELGQARNHRDALAFSLAQAELRSPVDGSLEAVLVRKGDQVTAGQVVARVVPGQAGLAATVFLAERHRAHLKPGQAVRLELAQYPYGEHGTLRARIRRIAEDLATPSEIREVLGEHSDLAAPAVRVEVALEDGPTRRTLALRSGMVLDCRFTLRRVPPITLILDPLKRWLR
jgi:membrane fusion protein